MKIPRNAKRIIEILQYNSHDAYVVGGCVRDTLMGQEPGDWDITTSARPEEVKRLFKRTIDTGIEHGTVTVLMSAGQDSGFEHYEVTTYRIDGAYSDHRRPDKVEFSDSLTEDLRRRDFTINAMAYNDAAGLVDEFGGQQDLKDRVIRCVGIADERFEEDALRMLRAVRFSAKLGFDIAQDTMEAIRRHAPELSHVSAERIYTELYKTLISPDPYKLQLLWELGLAAHVSPGFAKIQDAGGVLVTGTAHSRPRTGEAVRDHRIVSDTAQDRQDTKCCAGDADETGDRGCADDTAETADTDNNGCFGDEGDASGMLQVYETAASVLLRYAPWAGLMRNIAPEEAGSILRELKSDNDTIRNTLLVTAEYRHSLPQTSYEIKKCLNRIGPELFEDLLELKRDTCDDEAIEAARRLGHEILDRCEPYRISDLDIDGYAVMAMGYKGRKVGEMLEYLLDSVMKDPGLNNCAELERLAERKSDE